MHNPPDPASFYSAVWEIVRQIPVGRVSSYGQIASMIPPPEGIDPDAYRRLSPRWVGNAMRASPAGQSIPWQRVISSQGTISLPKGSADADEQRGLLLMEGVVFDNQDRVDFDRVGWEGPDKDWLAAHHFLPPRPLSKPAKPSQAQLSLL